MNVDEAIAHAREVAKRRMAEYKNHYDKDAHYYPMQCKKCAEEHIQLAEWLEELKQYRAIGTVEECRAAMEKQKPKKPVIKYRGMYDDDNGDYLMDKKYNICPSCNPMKEVYIGWKHCPYCGQRLDWGDK